LQQLLNRGTIADASVTPQTLRALLDSGRVRSPIWAEDLAYLQHFGVLRRRRPPGRRGAGAGVRRQRCSANLHEDEAFDAVCQHMLGTRLLGGITMTGGFFLGPRDFYERLRTMPPHELAKIDMTRIDFINQLYGQEDLKRAQRARPAS
jgi:hypothetical protein